MYTLAQLDIFVRVAKTGSFNKAAEEAYITPSAVMKHINNPIKVGKINATNVQNLLFVSFLIVNIVVLHGK